MTKHFCPLGGGRGREPLSCTIGEEDEDRLVPWSRGQVGECNSSNGKTQKFCLFSVSPSHVTLTLRELPLPGLRLPGVASRLVPPFRIRFPCSRCDWPAWQRVSIATAWGGGSLAGEARMSHLVINSLLSPCHSCFLSRLVFGVLVAPARRRRRGGGEEEERWRGWRLEQQKTTVWKQETQGGLI